jgi:hypothetical protein
LPRLILALAGAAAAFALVVADAPAARERCHTSQLRVQLEASDPGAGQRYAYLQLKNDSGDTCTIKGYAGAQLLRSGDQDVATRIVRDRSRTPRTVTLEPGEHASARMHWGVVATDEDRSASACQPLPSAIIVTPPDETDPLSTRWRLGRVCDAGRIDVGPFHATSRG